MTAAEAIGVVDESGHPKKGTQTACVDLKYCGNTVTRHRIRASKMEKLIRPSVVGYCGR